MLQWLKKLLGIDSHTLHEMIKESIEEAIKEDAVVEAPVVEEKPKPARKRKPRARKTQNKS